MFGSFGSGDGQLNDPAGCCARLRRERLRGGQRATTASRSSARRATSSPSGEAPAAAVASSTTPEGWRSTPRVTLFVSDDRNHRIQEFDANGNLIAKWGARGDGPGELIRPAGLSVDSAGAAVGRGREQPPDRALLLSRPRTERRARLGAPAPRPAPRHTRTRPRRASGSRQHRPEEPPRQPPRARAAHHNQRASEGRAARRRVEARRAPAPPAHRFDRPRHADLSAHGTRALRLRLTASARRRSCERAGCASSCARARPTRRATARAPRSRSKSDGELREGSVQRASPVVGRH